MLEDPKLTRDILAYFARDEVGFPAQVTLEELQRAFNDETPDKLADHTKLAIDLELLGGQYKIAPLQGGGEDLIFRALTGLTRQGSVYLKMARSPAWRNAFDHFKASGQKITTALLLKRLAGILDT